MLNVLNIRMNIYAIDVNEIIHLLIDTWNNAEYHWYDIVMKFFHNNKCIIKVCLKCLNAVFWSFSALNISIRFQNQHEVIFLNKELFEFNYCCITIFSQIELQIIYIYKVYSFWNFSIFKYLHTLTFPCQTMDYVIPFSIINEWNYNSCFHIPITTAQNMLISNEMTSF